MGKPKEAARGDAPTSQAVTVPETKPTMPTADPTAPTPAAEPAADAPQRVLTPEARRALQEADERRKAAQAAKRPAEYGGQGGPDPIRYGDWEKGGIVSDF